MALDNSGAIPPTTTHETFTKPKKNTLFNKKVVRNVGDSKRRNFR